MRTKSTLVHGICLSTIAGITTIPAFSEGRDDWDFSASVQIHPCEIYIYRDISAIRFCHGIILTSS